MNKNKAKELVVEWSKYGLDKCGLNIPDATICSLTLQFVDFLYKNKYQVISGGKK